MLQPGGVSKVAVNVYNPARGDLIKNFRPT